QAYAQASVHFPSWFPDSSDRHEPRWAAEESPRALRRPGPRPAPPRTARPRRRRACRCGRCRPAPDAPGSPAVATPSTCPGPDPGPRPAEAARAEAWHRGGPPGSKLFIGGITPQTTSEDLQRHFAEHGHVLDAVAMKGRDHPRGFGFVTFASPDAAARAALAENWLDGRLLDVKWAVPRSIMQGARSPCGLPSGIPSRQWRPEGPAAPAAAAQAAGGPARAGARAPEALGGALAPAAAAALVEAAVRGAIRANAPRRTAAAVARSAVSAALFALSGPAGPPAAEAAPEVMEDFKDKPKTTEAKLERRRRRRRRLAEWRAAGRAVLPAADVGVGGPTEDDDGMSLDDEWADALPPRVARRRQRRPAPDHTAVVEGAGVAVPSAAAVPGAPGGAAAAGADAVCDEEADARSVPSLSRGFWKEPRDRTVDPPVFANRVRLDALPLLSRDLPLRGRHLLLAVCEARERLANSLASSASRCPSRHRSAGWLLIAEVGSPEQPAEGGVFARYFSDEGDAREPPPPIFVGVKRYALDVLFLDDLLELSKRVSKGDLALTTLDQLRQSTGVPLSDAGVAALGQGQEAFGKAVLSAQRRGVAMGEAETTEAEFWRINAEGGGGAGRQGGWVKPQLQKGFETLVVELVRALGCGGEGVLIFLPGIGEISELFDALSVLESSEPALGGKGGARQHRQSHCEYKIFVLHSTIPMDEQEAAFHQAPDNVCHVFLASNIAESSVTLPKVRVVIDFCLRRMLTHDRTRHGLNCLMTQWVSHASASQRSGRAGRVFPGVAIRLVPRAFYASVMPQYDPPEIEQAPLEKLYLHVKQLSHRLRERMPRIGALPPRRLLEMTVQPPPSENIEEAVQILWEPTRPPPRGATRPRRSPSSAAWRSLCPWSCASAGWCCSACSSAVRPTQW
ncbi:unnamed protein product, partial [Prorocentrum cordatum]